MKKKSETINIGLTQCFSIGNYDDLIDILEKELNDTVNNPEVSDDDELINISGLNKTLNIWESHSETPTGITEGVVAKIPIVLSQVIIPITIDFNINLPESIFEIKDIKKRLKITQCLLLPAPDGAAGRDVLFIEGFVRKNIEFATRTCSNAEGVCGDIRHCTVDAPFRCSTPIGNFCRAPQGPMVNSREEFEYLREETLPRETFAEKDRLMSGDFSEFNQRSEEFFNELPFCELIRSQITEFDEFINRIRPSGVTLPFEEMEFREIEEKMAIAITLKILQKQQVVVPPTLIQPCPIPGLSNPCGDLIEAQVENNGVGKEEIE